MIGRSVRFHRQKRKLSQEQFALNAGINTSYLGQIERAEKNPTIITLEKIAIALDITLLDLLSDALEGKEQEVNRNKKQLIAMLTPDDIREYIHEIIKDELDK